MQKKDKVLFYREDEPGSTKQFSRDRDIREILVGELGDKFSLYRALFERAASFEVETEYPVHIDFETSFACDLKCIMCTHADGFTESPRKAFMDFELFKKIIDEGRRYCLWSVGLDQEGDPLLHPQLIDFIKYARQQGVIDVFFNTSAFRLDREMTEALLHSGLTRIHFSIDAASKETYDKIRVGSDFEKVKANIIYFCRRKKELGKVLPIVRASFVRMSTNEDELEKFIEFWKPYVDAFGIQEFGKAFDEESLDELFPKKDRLKLKEVRCPQPWIRMVVLTDGTVLPCCMLGYSLKNAVGNAYKDSIYSLWNSTKVRNLRKIQKEGKYYKNAICKKCAENFL